MNLADYIIYLYLSVGDDINCVKLLQATHCRKNDRLPVQVLLENRLVEFRKKKNSNDDLMVIPEQYIIILTVVWDYFNDHIILNTKYIRYYISPTTVNKNSIHCTAT